jgi:hypothetical protein
MAAVGFLRVRDRLEQLAGATGCRFPTRPRVAPDSFALCNHKHACYLHIKPVQHLETRKDGAFPGRWYPSYRDPGTRSMVDGPHRPISRTAALCFVIAPVPPNRSITLEFTNKNKGSFASSFIFFSPELT